MSDTGQQPAGWYYAQGDPPGTQRYWDGTQWQGGPQPVAGGAGFPAAGGAGSQPLSSAGKRIGARIIDVLIWSIVSFILAAIFGVSLTSTEISGSSFFAGLIGALFVVAYETWFVANQGGTPGKLALGMKVIRQDGAEMDTATAFKRIAIYLVGIVPAIGGVITFIVGVISFVLLFTDSSRQAVWDKIATTVVVDG